jgi:hypothetical protein
MGLVGIMLAAQVAHAAPAKIGTVYTKEGAESTTNAGPTIIVSMDLPAGRYHISGRGTFNNFDFETPDTVDCYVYAGALVPVDRNMTTAPSGGYAALAFEGVVVIPSGGAPVWVQCISSTSREVGGPYTSVRLVATLVPNIVDAP